MSIYCGSQHWIPRILILHGTKFSGYYCIYVLQVYPHPRMMFSTPSAARSWSKYGHGIPFIVQNYPHCGFFMTIDYLAIFFSYLSMNICSIVLFFVLDICCGTGTIGLFLAKVHTQTQLRSRGSHLYVTCWSIRNQDQDFWSVKSVFDHLIAWLCLFEALNHLIFGDYIAVTHF